MRFAHSLGCAHGSLKPTNILFDKNYNVQIVDFCSNRLHGRVSLDVEVSERCEVDNEEEALQDDVFSFSSILFEILVGRCVVAQVARSVVAHDVAQAVIPSFVPLFIRALMEKGWSADRPRRPSFRRIYQVLKKNDFDIVEGNEVKEVLRFVSSLEASQN
jgi:hypothetical protein